jgi:phosphoadenosine phosphosulfate reductase
MTATTNSPSRYRIAEWQESLQTKQAVDIIRWAVGEFGTRLAFASSLGAEDQVITHFLAETSSQTRIFTLDTGRLFPECHELMERTEKHYNLKIEVFMPDSSEVESMVKNHGINLFYKSAENRKLCCAIRKIHPLGRALEGVEAWICGLRRQQGVTRQQVQVVEWDDQHGIAKINPLWNWPEDKLWNCIKKNLIPYNPLHDRGFLSIGCSCCTRAVAPGDDLRAGRWWWENAEQRECGLHLKDGKPVRAR